MVNINHNSNYDCFASRPSSVDGGFFLDTTIEGCSVLRFKVIVVSRWLVGIHSKSVIVFEFKVSHNMQHCFEMPLSWVGVMGAQK